MSAKLMIIILKYANVRSTNTVLYVNHISVKLKKNVQQRRNHEMEKQENNADN